MKDFRNLLLWEKGHQMPAVYHALDTFPKEERYALADQIRRAAVSVPANIAEGSGRGTDADFAHFLQIAMGSASKLEYEILLTKNLGYIPAQVRTALNLQITEVKQMLASFLKKLTADR